MSSIRLNMSERTERLLENLKCRTDANSEVEVVSRALKVYDLIGVAIEQGHKIVIGTEPINLMEFHLITGELPPAPGFHVGAEDRPKFRGTVATDDSGRE